jgi:universal stress protein A
MNADIIVVGSHARHGWRRLLGSTASAVLQGAPLDVIVARLPEKAD